MVPMAQVVGQQGSNRSIYQFFFIFIDMILNFEDCFFAPVKNIILRRFLVGASWNKKPTFVGTLFFIIFILIFKITTNFLLYAVIVFRCIVF